MYGRSKKTETKVIDSKLQKAQQLFLTVGSWSDMSGHELAKLILDSIISIGSANEKLNMKRQDLIRPELNATFRPLFSGETDKQASGVLFGNKPSP